MSDIKFIVTTPARNEADFIGKTIESIISQTVLPWEWIIIDDGSTDDTAKFVKDLTCRYPWIKYTRRENRGYRDLDAGLVDAIYFGLSAAENDDYEFLFNIDADVLLGSNFFEKILEKFKENDDLGIATGEVYEFLGQNLVKLRALPLAMTGPVKCWRRKCFQQIGGLVRGLGWDGIDCFKAMILGWQAKTFEDLDLRVIHLRPQGSSQENIYRVWIRRGQAHHFIGSHPLWVAASVFYHLVSKPYVLGSLFMVSGYFKSLYKRNNQYENELLQRHLRIWQLKKLANILRLT
jgi:poly-beta-1,6-N-acetyl-D-glucosamine synthase